MSHKSKRRWWYTHEEASRFLKDFPHGPLAGANQKQLATAVCSVWGLKPDRRSLQTLAKSNDILVVKADGHQQAQVYFRHQPLFVEAAENLKNGKNKKP